MASIARAGVPDVDTPAWKPTKWQALHKEDLVSVTWRDGSVGVGRVEDCTYDRSVYWVRHAATGERQLFIPAEDQDPWLPC